MSLTDTERDNIRKTWAKRRELAIAQEKTMKEEAMERAGKIAKFLKDKYAIKKVYLYGSLSREGPFDKYSDIDLFIDGWNEDLNYWTMYIEVEKIAMPFAVSVITEKEITSELKEKILKEGKII
jgi:predicted nucleotidyltransferase